MLKRKVLERAPSTGNVFADLSLADSAEQMIKAGLVVRIGRIIRQRKLTQAAAAQLYRLARGVEAKWGGIIIGGPQARPQVRG